MLHAHDADTQIEKQTYNKANKKTKKREMGSGVAK